MQAVNTCAATAATLPELEVHLTGLDSAAECAHVSRGQVPFFECLGAAYEGADCGSVHGLELATTSAARCASSAL